MRKILAAGVAALTFGAATLASVEPASAAGWHGGGWRGGGGWGWGGGAVVAGVAGLALGATLAGGPYYGPHYYYGPGYYSAYYGAYGCYAPRRIWDPYVGHYVIERARYAC